MEEMERLSASQLFLYNTIAATSMERARKSIRKAKLSNERIENLKKAMGKFQEDDVRIVLNIDLHKIYLDSNLSVVDGLISTGRFLNRFEVEIANSIPLSPNMLSRVMEEFLLYGAKPDLIYTLALLPAGERPNYGALDFIGNPGALPLLGYYGPYRFRLKKSIVHRSTFTAGSIAVTPANEVYTWNSIDGILVSPLTANNGKRLFEYVLEKSGTPEYFFQRAYVEAQILGGIRLKEDVDLLSYPAVDRYSAFYEKIQQLSEKFGIESQPY